MGLHHRKLIPQICELLCHTEQEPCLSDCKVCIKVCLTNPYSYYYSQPPPSTPLYLDQQEHHEGKHHKISTYLILSFSILLAAFFVVCCHAIYTKFFSRRRSRRVSILSRQQQTQENHDDFVDEEHGPVVDHPIWYIRTLGLHESIISAITVCKYKKGEGLIEGTECSVCLSEFQEDESLRLLPKCHHAFHLPCIDTWLASHTNCPMCRAPIVTNPTRIPSLLPNNVVLDPTSLENSAPHTPQGPQLRNGSEEGEWEVQDETRVCETESVVVNIRPRRSVSLDSSSVANINLALANVQSSVQSGENEGIVSKRFITGNENFPTSSNSKRSSSFRTRYLHSVLHSSMKRSHSYNGKYLVSWYSLSQRKQNASLGSF
ncbi:hypothetical protein Lal_00041305 [Lupinus albus]|uniref:RING-type E3 ubiquitin transferase n=1 Tax=Lupinus albus TaxID=3870 RepID=A0A6A4P730_LUPAL|nr:putative transcription factor C2H2 family [Lupinus albus]KAF1890527.1 hypothetical protein Lal_00041305 [Lupinus albus]